MFLFWEINIVNMEGYCCKKGVSDKKCKGCSLYACPKCIIVYNGYCQDCNKNNEFKIATKNNTNLRGYIKYLQMVIKDNVYDIYGDYYYGHNYFEYEETKQWKEKYYVLKREGEKREEKHMEEYECEYQ